MLWPLLLLSILVWGGCACLHPHWYVCVVVRVHALHVCVCANVRVSWRERPMLSYSPYVCVHVCACVVCDKCMLCVCDAYVHARAVVHTSYMLEITIFVYISYYNIFFSLFALSHASFFVRIDSKCTTPRRRNWKMLVLYTYCSLTSSLSVRNWKRKKVSMYACRHNVCVCACVMSVFEQCICVCAFAHIFLVYIYISARVREAGQ